MTEPDKTEILVYHGGTVIEVGNDPGLSLSYFMLSNLGCRFWLGSPSNLKLGDKVTVTIEKVSPNNDQPT
jgi:hypothetical protein